MISQQKLQDVSRDTNKGDDERRDAYKTLLDRKLNPAKDFNPETFDPMSGVPDFELRKRTRIKPDRRLETMGMQPKEILQGQMIGMYESKQDLYLLIAHLYNRVADLEDKLP